MGSEPQSHPFAEAIHAHVRKYVGEPAPLAGLVHRVPAGERFPFQFLYTCGMSSYPMPAPEGREEWSRAELFLGLPEDWPLDPQALRERENGWPVNILNFLARFPREANQWLWYGHTVPNGNPPAPFYPESIYNSVILLGSSEVPRGFEMLRPDEQQTVRFFSVLPLCSPELEFKLRKGAAELEQRLRKAEVTEVVRRKRISTVHKTWVQRMMK